jgi:hypothetical protein
VPNIESNLFFILNTKEKILNFFKNFGEDKSVRNSSRCPIIKILGAPVLALTAHRINLLAPEFYI